MSNEMTDRELLELAAKAAGYHWPLVWPYPSPVDVPHDWNPLISDGDALRLAVRLNLLVHIETCYYSHAMKEHISATEHIGNDGKGCIYEATRRAIVRAAAEIGRSME